MSGSFGNCFPMIETSRTWFFQLIWLPQESEWLIHLWHSMSWQLLTCQEAEPISIAHCSSSLTISDKQLQPQPSCNINMKDSRLGVRWCVSTTLTQKCCVSACVQGRSPPTNHPPVCAAPRHHMFYHAAMPHPAMRVSKFLPLKQSNWDCGLFVCRKPHTTKSETSSFAKMHYRRKIFQAIVEMNASCQMFDKLGSSTGQRGPLGLRPYLGLRP